MRCFVTIVPQQHSAKPPRFVDSETEFAQLVDRIAHKPRIACDTEAASFHRYVDRVYLIQLSWDSETAIVDPLALKDLSPLGELLANPDLEVVFHDADYDLRTLHRDYKFTACNIFDTRIAAQFAKEPRVGLGALLEKYFGVKPNKRLQRADWSRRPLTLEMIEYAADDTRYLLQLRDQLERELKRLNRFEWAKEEFRHLEGLRWRRPAEDDQAFLRIKGAKALQPRSRAVLRELHTWRENTARTLDRAPFRVLTNAALVSVAQAAPRTTKRLQNIPGLPASVAKRHGSDFLEAVDRGLKVPKEDWPRIKRAPRPEHDHGYEGRLERLKQIRDHRASEEEMQPGHLCPNGTLQAIARAVPKTPKQLEKVKELRRWQLDALGADLLLGALQDGGDQ